MLDIKTHKVNSYLTRIGIVTDTQIYTSLKMTDKDILCMWSKQS